MTKGKPRGESKGKQGYYSLWQVLFLLSTLSREDGSSQGIMIPSLYSIRAQER